MREDKCRTKFCRNRRIHWRSLCAKCRSRAYKAQHPRRYHFNLLRCRTYERGIPFGLTFEDYERFCKETGYFENKGTELFSMTIDRIDPSKGYRLDNIRVVTHYENSCRSDKTDEEFDKELSGDPF